jgi:hypothetical protein
MKVSPSALPSLLLAMTASTAPLAAQSNPYRGLWVGEVVLGAVNETTVALDEDNIPRASDPNLPTPTSDAANLRLILHVDATGRTTLLKQVALLARKAGLQESENDLALVTDERLYGAFPPQPARRISSVVFDYGDAKATAAMDNLVEAVATEAARAAQVGSPSIASVSGSAEAKGVAAVNAADASEAFNTFINSAPMSPAALKAIANGGSDAAAREAATDLKNSSFFGDTRGIEMLDAIAAAVASLPSGASQAQREQLAINTASAFVETDLGYDRFLAGELLGDLISASAEAAAAAAQTVPLNPVTAFQASASGPLVTVVAPAHTLATGDEIAIQGAALAAYNGLHKIVRVDDGSFQIQADHVAGGPVAGYAARTGVGPLTVTSAGHGLSSNDHVTIRGSLPAYNGRHLVTVLDADRFTIDLPFDSDPADRGSWFSRSGQIVRYEGTDDGGAGVKITAPGHGLNNGQQIEIRGSGTPSYNGPKTITRLSADTFSIPQAFGGDPAVKGSWELLVPISAFAGPASVPSVVTAPAHGLASGDRVVIAGSGHAPNNGTFEVTVIDADRFALPVDFDPATGNPAVKGSWQPAPGGQWRKAGPVRAALDALAKVDEARTVALGVSPSLYDDSRAPDAVEVVLDAIVGLAATSDGTLSTRVAVLAAEAGREALRSSVRRYPRPSTVPSTDYDEFVRSAGFSGAPKIAADAAADAALREKAGLLATPASIKDKALQAALNALTPVFATAARSLLTELPMSGGFGPGGPGLTTEIMLPANHPTNPFRHRRHPDHTVGFNITREIALGFDAADLQPRGGASYGIDRISGTYDEEIFGLHKPLGPQQDIGLKVRGTFVLNRISLIDTLNGR